MNVSTVDSCFVWPQVPQSPAYQIYATIVAFYLPLSVILILNAKIYITARRIITKVKMVLYVTQKSLLGPIPDQIGPYICLLHTWQ